MRALLVLLGSLAIVLTVAVTSATAIDRPQTFSLLEVDESDIAINGFDFQREPRAGDGFGFISGLYKWAGTKRGARVGHDEGVCTFLKVSLSEQNFSASAHCVASFFLPAGSVLVEGFIHFTEGPSRFEVPVGGGTGAYANSRGFARIRDIGAEDSGHSNVEFHLLP
jgi:hypothetical protein